jgi:hypothetical protein
MNNCEEIVVSHPMCLSIFMAPDHQISAICINPHLFHLDEPCTYEKIKCILISYQAIYFQD